MRHVLLILALVSLAFVGPSPIAAEEPGDDLEQIPSCGAVRVDSQLWQSANYARYVEGYSQSSRNLDGCASKMRVEAWVEGVTMSTAITEGYGMATSIAYGTPVPNYGMWNSTGKHWLINFGMWLWNGYSHGQATLQERPRTPQEDCDVILQQR